MVAKILISGGRDSNRNVIMGVIVMIAVLGRRRPLCRASPEP